MRRTVRMGHGEWIKMSTSSSDGYVTAGMTNTGGGGGAGSDSTAPGGAGCYSTAWRVRTHWQVHAGQLLHRLCPLLGDFLHHHLPFHTSSTLIELVFLRSAGVSAMSLSGTLYSWLKTEATSHIPSTCSTTFTYMTLDSAAEVSVHLHRHPPHRPRRLSRLCRLWPPMRSVSVSSETIRRCPVPQPSRACLLLHGPLPRLDPGPD